MFSKTENERKRGWEQFIFKYVQVKGSSISAWFELQLFRQISLG